MCVCVFTRVLFFAVTCCIRQMAQVTIRTTHDSMQIDVFNVSLISLYTKTHVNTVNQPVFTPVIHKIKARL